MNDEGEFERKTKDIDLGGPVATDHEIPQIIEQIVNPIEANQWIERTLTSDNMIDVLHFSSLFGLIHSI